MTVVTRFAPSPTGFLHIGGARTALFNWLYARHNGGQYLLRIEDTDRKRSTPEAIDAILDGLSWLGLESDADIVYQSQNAERHAEAARTLVEAGKAYHCYCSPEELAEMRERARAEGHRKLYDGRWRDRGRSEAPAGIDPVVRVKMPQTGETTINDLVQGPVTIANDQLDDFILLRADGTPTYMLSVVVDDHDMGVTDVIRGDDHLTNAFRQFHLYDALGWDAPAFAHIPLIHGPDGAKLSKRHGALGVAAYRDMGYLPEALCNYLLRLGWSHGDDEVIPMPQAIEWFDLDAVGRSPARFDFDKLDSLNAIYLREAGADRLLDLIAPLIEALSGQPLDETGRNRIRRGLDSLKERSKTLKDLAEAAVIYIRRPAYPLATPKAAKMLEGDAVGLVETIASLLDGVDGWSAEPLEETLRGFAEKQELGFGRVAQPLRVALTGQTASPGLFEVMEVLGKEECLARLRAVPGVA